MPAPPPPRDPLFEVEHLSLVYAGSNGQPRDFHSEKCNPAVFPGV